MNLISKKYKKQNEALHKKGFGASGHRWSEIVFSLIEKYDITSMLDYGCGQSTLYKQLKEDYNGLFSKVQYKEYDPCIESKSICPSNAELVTCTDVLEHIEPKYIDNVLLHLFLLSDRIIFLNINTREANKTLPDGRNAHLIVQKGDWWIKKIKQVLQDQGILNDWKYNTIPVKNPKNFNVLLIKEKMSA